MDTNDTPLTEEEQAILKAAGYVSRGGGNINGDNVVWLKFEKGGRVFTSTRAEWRAVIAELNKPSTEDEAAFGRDAWVYCRSHMRAHQTGWCTVGVRDKVGLGVDNAQAARDKCRAWGFELYSDREQP